MDGPSIRLLQDILTTIMLLRRNRPTRDPSQLLSQLHPLLLPTHPKVFYNIKLLEVQYQVLDRLSITLHNNRHNLGADEVGFMITEAAEAAMIDQERIGRNR